MKIGDYITFRTKDDSALISGEITNLSKNLITIAWDEGKESTVPIDEIEVTKENRLEFCDVLLCDECPICEGNNPYRIPCDEFVAQFPTEAMELMNKI